MKYSIGDKVRVKQHESGSGHRPCAGWVTRVMNSYVGRIVTIYSVREDGYYFIDEDGVSYNWSDCMFEEVGRDPSWEIKL